MLQDWFILPRRGAWCIFEVVWLTIISILEFIYSLSAIDILKLTVSYLRDLHPPEIKFILSLNIFPE